MPRRQSCLTATGLLAALTLAGCFNPSQPDCSFQCRLSPDCPQGYECRADKFCHRIGSPATSVCAYPPEGPIADHPLVDAPKVDMAIADTKLPDARLADRRLPDTKLLDATPPDRKFLDAKLADMRLPDMKLPDATPPDMTPPDTVQYFALTVAAVGSGSVTSSPTGISCGGGATMCTAMFAKGSSVMLTASSTTSSLGWSGACTGSTSPCSVSMTAAESVTATFDSALSFNGSGKVSVADAAALDPTAGITVETWAKPASLPAAAPGSWLALIGKGSPWGASPRGYQLGYSPSGSNWVASFAVVTGTTPAVTNCAGTTVIAAAALHHLAGTYDGANVVVWLDGAQEAKCPVTGSLAPASNSLVMGAPADTSVTTNLSFTGVLDDARISNTAIYTAAFTTARHPTSTSGVTVALWPMDEGTGTTVTDRASTNNGTLGGTTLPAWVPEP